MQARNRKRVIRTSSFFVSIFVLVLAAITPTKFVSASAFYDNKDSIRNFAIYPGSRYDLPDAYFVLNRASQEYIRKKFVVRAWLNYLVLDLMIDNYNRKLNLKDTYIVTARNRFVRAYREYRVVRFYPDGKWTTVFYKYQCIGTGSCAYGSTMITSTVNIDLAGYNEGVLYALVITTWEYSEGDYNADINHWVIPFEIITSSEFTIDPPYKYANPGDTVNLSVFYPNTDETASVIAHLYSGPSDLQSRSGQEYTYIEPTSITQWTPRPRSSDAGITVQQSQQQHLVEFTIPADAPNGSVYTIEIQGLYSNFTVHRAFSQVIVGSPEPAQPAPEFSTLCPFILNPPWAIAGQTATVGCYDNPLDSYTVTGGKAWIPNGSASPLTNQGNGTLTASLTAPSTEGVVPVLYEVDVQDASGGSFKVSGSQNMIVTSSPNTMYCPPPEDGVTSAPGGEVGVRLFR